MKIGDRIYVHGFVDEIRKDCVIVRNDGGYFGTDKSEILVANNLDELVNVRHGKWKQWDAYGFEDTYECTACGEAFVLIEGTPITNGYKFCPNCGARMDGERKEE